MNAKKKYIPEDSENIDESMLKVSGRLQTLGKHISSPLDPESACPDNKMSALSFASAVNESYFKKNDSVESQTQVETSASLNISRDELISKLLFMALAPGFDANSNSARIDIATIDRMASMLILDRRVSMVEAVQRLYDEANLRHSAIKKSIEMKMTADDMPENNISSQESSSSGEQYIVTEMKKLYKQELENNKKKYEQATKRIQEEISDRKERDKRCKREIRLLTVGHKTEIQSFLSSFSDTPGDPH
uniref:Uncharacterized protein n=1 Tax=Corethron hystrix TaxID=216773 RepID=A0A6U5FNZ9_9STRA|mmetsp:Transcript_23453/g.53531  ORF Transcript_23453/g.53531 Transcript_23453/m.53531 type:complete len:249 (+) Transcript_23453:97-843(+)